MFYIILYHLLLKLYNFNILEDRTYEKKNGLKVFLIAFLIIMLCWLPFLFNYYPGRMGYDSEQEITAAIENNITSDWHTVAHQYFILIFYNIGNFLFHNANAAIAFSTFIQMVICASIFAYLILFLYKRNVNLKILLIMNILMGILPVYTLSVVTIFKDELFGFFVLLFIIHLIELIEQRDNVTWKKLIPIFISSLLVVFFRNNAIYMYFIFIPFAIWFFKGNRPKTIAVLSLVLITYFIVKGPVFNLLNIHKSETSEYLAMPLQQMGRMAYKDAEFTKEQEEFLNQMMPIDIMKESYNPTVADGIKFSDYLDYSFMAHNKFGLIKIYLSLIFSHFDIALESYFISTLGYWYPDIEKREIIFKPTEEFDLKNRYNIYNEIKLSENINEFIEKISYSDVPIWSMQWSLALILWIILIFLTVCWMKNGFASLLPYLPVVGIWLTLMVASPVWDEFRYIFSAYTGLPLLICYPYIYNKKSKK